MSLESVTSRAHDAATAAGRDPDSITLVAVSKLQPVDAIQRAYDAGHRDFGESRAQELVEKAAVLPPDIRWHFIGPLQRNKVRLVRPTVVLLHSMDRLRLAPAWLKGPGLAPPVLLQVNVGREPQKHGVAPEDAADAITQMRAMGVEIQGLMTIPPVGSTPEDARPFFADLVALRDGLATSEVPLPELSMGMTDDFEVAISAGSTMIRVGRAIFGPRTTQG